MEQTRSGPGGPPRTRDPPGYPPRTRDPPGHPPRTRDPPGHPPGTRDPPGYPPGTRDLLGYPPGTRDPLGYPPGTRDLLGYPPGTRDLLGYPPGTRDLLGYPPSTRDPLGYPPSMCDHLPGEKYLCCNCNHILKRAQQTACGHRYCAACLSGIIRRCESPVCPRCMEDPSSLTEDSYLTEGQAFSDTAINKEISELRVHCVMTGCKWSGVLGEYEKHNCEDPAKGKDPQSGAADCPYSSLGCSYRGSREKMAEHEESAAALHLSLVLPILRQTQNARPAAAVTENGFYNRDARRSPASLHNGESVYEEIAADCGHQNGAMTTSDLISRVCALENRIQVAENIITVMNREIDSYSAKLIAAREQSDEEQRKVRACEAKIAGLCCSIAKKEIEVNELHDRLENLQETTYDGIFLWRISGFMKKCQDASAGRTSSLYSPAFYTARYGYKVSLRIYLNGDGAGKGTHISLFFAIMRGEYDVLLPWPFKHKVTFMLLDQSNREHVIDAFRPDHTSVSFHRPVSDMNVASGCPLFCPLSKLQAIRNNYVRDDTMFIRCIIDTNA